MLVLAVSESNGMINGSIAKPENDLSFPRKRESTKSVTFLDPCFRRDDIVDELV